MLISLLSTKIGKNFSNRAFRMLIWKTVFFLFLYVTLLPAWPDGFVCIKKARFSGAEKYV